MNKNQLDALLHLLTRIVSTCQTGMPGVNALKELREFEAALAEVPKEKEGMLQAPESRPYSYVMWVSCEDRMPTGEGRYLILSGGNPGIGVWFCDEDGPGLRDERNYRWPSKVTHWMPIPESPLPNLEK